MASRVIRSLTGLAAVIVAYCLYALLVVPWIEPPAGANDLAQPHLLGAVHGARRGEIHEIDAADQQDAKAES